MRGKKWIVAAALALLLAPAALLAETRVRVGVAVGTHAHRARVVHGHHRHGHPHAVVRVYRPTRVVRVNYGSVDFNIEPQQSKVFVDGAYLGIADDFNGYPQTAKLPAGYHQVKVVAPDGSVAKQRIYVAAGQELNFNLKF